MSHVFFRKELEGVATFWRVLRSDGITLGFTSHDRDLWFDGVRHRAAPGMLPNAIRRSGSVSQDSAGIDGVLSHDSISEQDLAHGRFDNASIIVGAVDWETLDWAHLYSGMLGTIVEKDGSFSADLNSSKVRLSRETIPQTSPTCRASFCGPGCTLSAARFTVDEPVSEIDAEANALAFSAIDANLFVHGELRWLDGPHAGLRSHILAAQAGMVVVDTAISADIVPGTKARLRQGCDHRLTTCASRFSNALNFQGEPYLPGNDLLARYPLPQ